MGFSNTHARQSAILGLLDRILESGKEARIKCHPGRAQSKRAEIYHVRRVQQKEHKWTKYDDLQFTITKEEPDVILVRNAPDVEVEFIEGTTLRRSFDSFEGEPEPLVETTLEQDVERFRKQGYGEELIEEYRKRQEEEHNGPHKN